MSRNQIPLKVFTAYAFDDEDHCNWVKVFVSNHLYKSQLWHDRYDLQIDYIPNEAHSLLDYFEITGIQIPDIMVFYTESGDECITELAEDDEIGESVPAVIAAMQTQSRIGLFRASELERSAYDYVVVIYILLEFSTDDHQMMTLLRYIMNILYHQYVTLHTHDTDTADFFFKLIVIIAYKVIIHCGSKIESSIITAALEKRNYEPIKTFVEAAIDFRDEETTKSWSSSRLYRISDSSGLRHKIDELNKWVDDMLYYKESTRHVMNLLPDTQ